MSDFPAPGDKSKPWLPDSVEGQGQKPATRSWLPDPNDPRQLDTGLNYGRGLFRVWLVLTGIWTAAVAVWYLRNGTGEGLKLLSHLVIYAFMPALAVLLVGWAAFPVLKWVKHGFSNGKAV